MAAALTSAASGSVSDRLSRKRTIMIGAIIGAVGCFVEAAAIKLWMLILGRILAGAGEGLFINTISVYLVEISPPAVRGKTACTLQLLITIGIIVGYFTCYFSVSLPSTFSFRIPFIIQGICCCLLAVGTPLIPHSPRWLAAKGREEEAWRVIAVFDPEGGDRQREKIQDALQREREYHDELHRRRMLKSSLASQRQAEEVTSGKRYAPSPVGAALSSIKENEHVAAVADAFGKGRKERTLFGMLLMGLQQLSGIDGVLFYAPILFAQAGLGSRKASFLASGISGIVNFVATIPSQFWLIDKWGRRPCWIIGGLVMGFCMTVIGAMYASGYVKQDAGRWIVIALIYVFVSAFAMTWAVVGKILTTEMQPSRTRATASSLAQTTNWLVNVIVALTTPVFLQRSPSGPYFMFGGFLCWSSSSSLAE
ncbi:SubName: Full=Related to sugar transporter {ECO:0000313/EMBL:CCA69766.1} [Serendipita indica DSM 11827]|nr:SubName: Full=Related to sugar transporter {ECO:0000313/EMBL:CCA69766.1} [Serendipita indica DSM 11827]